MSDSSCLVSTDPTALPESSLNTDPATATPEDVRKAAGESPQARKAADRILKAWERLQKQTARAGEAVRQKVAAITPYVLAKMKAMVARVAELAAQGTGWTLDRLIRLDDLTRGHLKDLATYAAVVLLAIGCWRDPFLLVRLGEAALTGLLESATGFIRLVLSGLALLLVARLVCAAARWAWDLSRSVLSAILNGLGLPAARLAEALQTPAVAEAAA
ncbi:MAG: hypothetical protein ABFD16_16235 [Thermoguttaceae bacterium]|jgi:hypothetical protein